MALSLENVYNHYIVHQGRVLDKKRGKSKLNPLDLNKANFKFDN